MWNLGGVWMEGFPMWGGGLGSPGGRLGTWNLGGLGDYVRHSLVVAAHQKAQMEEALVVLQVAVVVAQRCGHEEELVGAAHQKALVVLQVAVVVAQRCGHEEELVGAAHQKAQMEEALVVLQVAVVVAQRCGH